mgnify:CR=1 FL=1
MKTDYQKQGTDFLTETGTTMKVDFVGNDYHFDDDKEKRDIYRVTLERNGRKYSFRFGQSIAKSGIGGLFRSDCEKCDKLPIQDTKEAHRSHTKRQFPTAYDVLTCLTKHDPGSIDDFSDEYGVRDLKPSKLQKTYNAVREEWEGVRLLFSDVMEKLQEIQ